MAAWTYSMPFPRVKATSWAAVEPASRMWYPEMEMVLKLGTSSAQNSKMSVMIRIEGPGG